MNDKLDAVIAFMEHQRVWNEIDKTWSHPSYCVTCSNIGLLKRQLGDEQSN